MRLFDPNNPTLNFFAMPRGLNTYLWSPTARLKDAGTGTFYETARTKSTVYWKGVNERLEMSPTNGVSWKWRRLVIEMKSYRPGIAYEETSAGYVRKWARLPDVDATALAGLVFDGTNELDYNTFFLGKTDSNRVKVHYDKTRVLSTGNQASYIKTYKQWMPLEKNMIYDEDEVGNIESNQPWAATGMKGMGDIFIWDIFTDIGAGVADTLTLRNSSTVYWHEK